MSWPSFSSQLVLALRYIHKEKHVIHRDLTPANVMLGEGDKLTISECHPPPLLNTQNIYLLCYFDLLLPFQLTLVWQSKNRKSSVS